jgi:hypothetical protein
MKGVPTAARSIFVCRTSIRRPLLPVIAIVPYPALPTNVTEVIFTVSRCKGIRTTALTNSFEYRLRRCRNREEP